MESQASEESNQIKALDEAFKSFIDDMKPFVLSLSEKKGISYVLSISAELLVAFL